MNKNLGELFRRRAYISPDVEAIVDLAAGQRFSYAELNQRINALAHSLAARGVKRGDHVAMLLFNAIEFVDTFYAAAKLGAVAVPLNWRLVADELAFILKDCGATSLIYGVEFIDAVADLHDRGGAATDITNWIEVGPADKRQVWADPYDSLISEGDTAEPDCPSDNDDLMFIMYTSGTTGLPKGVMHTHNTIFGAQNNVLTTMDLGPRDRYLIVLPLFHVGALTPIISAMHCGTSVVLMRQFDPVAMWDVIEKERIATTLAVPAMLNFMLTVPDFDKRDLSALRNILSGASPVPATLIEKYKAYGIEIEQVYGMTETGGPGCYIGGKDAIERAGSTGRGYMMTDVRVVDDDLNDVPPGEPGQILLRGDHNMIGYWNRPDATAETLRDGWLLTGDVAIMDVDGFVTIHDRIKDMVISGGTNIYPREVEEILLRHELVAEVSVIGRPDPEWGEVLIAYVVPARAGEEEPGVLDAFCLEHMARFKRPKAYKFVAELPKNNYGKVLKTTLRELDAKRGE